MTIAGIDSSLRAAGVAVLATGLDGQLVPTTTTVRSVGRSSDTTADRARRITRQRNGILDRVRGADIAIIEAPAYSQNSAFSHEISWLWGAVYSGLQHLGIPVVDVPPTTLKKFACGSGAAKKVDVAVAVSRMWPNCPAAGDDEYDALALATAGAVHARLPVPFLVLERHRLALAKLAWPAPIPRTEEPPF